MCLCVPLSYTLLEVVLIESGLCVRERRVVVSTSVIIHTQLPSWS